MSLKHGSCQKNQPGPDSLGDALTDGGLGLNFWRPSCWVTPWLKRENPRVFQEWNQKSSTQTHQPEPWDMAEGWTSCIGFLASTFGCQKETNHSTSSQEILHVTVSFCSPWHSVLKLDSCQLITLVLLVLACVQLVWSMDSFVRLNVEPFQD